LVLILGLLSDSHGQAERTRNALRILRHVGAEAYVHCGDVGGLDVLDQLAGLRAWIVCGNTDCPDHQKVEYAEQIGLRIGQEPPVRLELAGRHIAVFHGHERGMTELIEALLETGSPPASFGRCDYLFHGHTHNACDYQLGPVRIINPGALHRAVVYTVATVDLATDRVRFWDVPDDPEYVPALDEADKR
jgi:putative phosphoesterase